MKLCLECRRTNGTLSLTCFVILRVLILCCFINLFNGMSKNGLAAKQHYCNYFKNQHNSGLVFNKAFTNV